MLKSEYYYKFDWDENLSGTYWAYMFVVDHAGNFVEHPENWVDTRIVSIKELKRRVLKTSRELSKHKIENYAYRDYRPFTIDDLFPKLFRPELCGYSDSERATGSQDDYQSRWANKLGTEEGSERKSYGFSDIS